MGDSNHGRKPRAVRVKLANRTSARAGTLQQAAPGLFRRAPNNGVDIALRTFKPQVLPASLYLATENLLQACGKVLA